ncbi:sensor histidine kinase [Spongiactinospora rosea]|nr:histidine kinase [Spongiactinospora rosea]
MVTVMPADGPASRFEPPAHLAWSRRFLEATSVQRTTWGWYGVAVVFSAPLDHALVTTVTSAAAPAWKVTKAGLLLAYLALYILGAPAAARRSTKWRAVFCCAITGVGLMLVLGHDLAAWNLAHLVAALSLALWWPVALVVTGATLLVAGLTQGGWGLLFLMVIVLTVAPLRHAWQEYLLLEQAQARIAEARVHEDRERLARDLHDVIGSTLTTLTVKAGLARRLLEDGAAGRAVQEVRDIERLGRQALADVRATVAANHRPSLPDALADAEAALSAAGIRPDVRSCPPDVPERVQVVFAYVLREGVTNVIKHSRAGRCAIRVTASTMEIADDGIGGARGLGHGLRGLTERLCAVGGTLTAGPGAEGGHLLRAEFPS